MSRLSRRQALAGFGSVSLGALIAACSGDDDNPTAQVETSEGTTSTVEPKGSSSDLASRFDDAATCTQTAEQTEGPFYFDVDRIRSDIREDREGATLRLGVRVRDAAACEPIANAVVDVWHCDAEGSYFGGRRDLPARRPGHEPRRHRRVHDDLPRLVSRAGRCTSTPRSTSTSKPCSPPSSTSTTRSARRSSRRRVRVGERPRRVQRQRRHLRQQSRAHALRGGRRPPRADHARRGERLGGVDEPFDELAHERCRRSGGGEHVHGAAARGALSQRKRNDTGSSTNERESVHRDHGDPGGDEGMRGGQVIELVGDPWREARLPAELLHDGSEAARRRVAPRKHQLLGLELRDAYLVTPRQRDAPPGRRRRGRRPAGGAARRPVVSGTATPGMWWTRNVRLPAAQAFDRLARLELEHLDDQVRMRAPKVAHGCRDERRQGTREGRETQPLHIAADVLDPAASAAPAAASTRSACGRRLAPRLGSPAADAWSGRRAACPPRARAQPAVARSRTACSPARRPRLRWSPGRAPA